MEIIDRVPALGIALYRTELTITRNSEMHNGITQLGITDGRTTWSVQANFYASSSGILVNDARWPFPKHIPFPLAGSQDTAVYSLRDIIRYAPVGTQMKISLIFWRVRIDLAETSGEHKDQYSFNDIRAAIEVRFPNAQTPYGFIPTEEIPSISGRVAYINVSVAVSAQQASYSLPTNQYNSVPGTARRWRWRDSTNKDALISATLLRPVNPDNLDSAIARAYSTSGMRPMFDSRRADLPGHDAYIFNFLTHQKWVPQGDEHTPMLIKSEAKPLHADNFFCFVIPRYVVERTDVLSWLIANLPRPEQEKLIDAAERA